MGILVQQMKAIRIIIIPKTPNPSFFGNWKLGAFSRFYSGRVGMEVFHFFDC